MRVHRLELQAFGPFPGREVVDLDALADSGLFLLHGPTGAGKTSVLDAVCFALYGRVPGTRGEGSRLRSDHADPQVPPQVVCEFSAGLRRFEVTRSPAWERPKRRGGGTTVEQARVLVRELTVDGWVALSSRIDEAAHLLDDVLGMGPDQFTKLVLLPQGEFAAFLRADAQVRRALLEKLFGTDRFTAVQEYLRDRRAALRGEVQEAGRHAGDLLARSEQACAGVQRPTPPTAPSGAMDPGIPQQESSPQQGAGPEESNPEQEYGPPDLGGRVARLSVTAGQLHEDALARRAATQSALARAQGAQARAAAAADRVREWVDLTARQHRLETLAPEQARARNRLAEAERTAALGPLLPAVELARARSAAARAALDRATADHPEGGAASDAELGGQLGALRDALAELAPVEVELRALPDLALEVEQAESAGAAAEGELERCRSALAVAQAQLARHTSLAGEAGARAEGADAATAALRAAQAVAQAVLDRDRLAERVESQRRRHAADETSRNLAWQAWLDLRERRLAGIAAELAGTLTPGESCRVCGSTDHPRPAVPGAATVTADHESAAHARFTAADRQRDAALTALRAAETELAAVTALAGPATAGPATAASATAGSGTAASATAGTAAQALAAAELRLRKIEQAATAQRGALAEVATQQAAADAARLAAAAAEARLQGARQVLDQAGERLAGLRRRAETARGTDPDLASRRARLEALAAAGQAVLDARRLAAPAAGQLAELEATAAQAAHEAGFGSLEAALAATLDDGQRVRLQESLARFDGEVASITRRRGELAGPTLEAVLAASAGRPGVSGPPPLPGPPDVADVADVDALVATVADRLLDPARAAGLAHDVEQAHLADEAAAAEVGVRHNAVQQLAELATLAREHIRRTAPLLDRFRTLDELTRCVEGTGGENARRMTLSAYVLAARLEQVAAAATLRLSQMSGGRYQLQHTDAVDRGRGRSGLSLEVVDSWTGSRRDTASLSGGESFYTSLALALGLADVVSAETGGLSIETLFVDEGFGSLDDDTLDEVMDVLDGLRASGRSIGIVSHVADLRSRIPAQLEVRKTEDGSTLRLVPTG